MEDENDECWLYGNTEQKDGQETEDGPSEQPSQNDEVNQEETGQEGQVQVSLNHLLRKILRFHYVFH